MVVSVIGSIMRFLIKAEVGVAYRQKVNVLAL